MLLRLRMCFSEEPGAEMTQIELWKSYQGTFMPYSATHTPLIAGEFIKNVSTTFKGATAQVAAANKYVIRGIKPRAVPVDYRGKELLQCRWRTQHPTANTNGQSASAPTTGVECAQYYPNNPAILEHILSHHLQIPRKKATPTDNEQPLKTFASSIKLFDFAAADPNQSYRCAWSLCRHSPAAEGLKVSSPWVDRAFLARHIETHLPDSIATMTSLKSKGLHVSSDNKRTETPRYWLNTLTDERNDAAGVPLGACLVMRNIARGISKMAPESAAQKEALARTDGGIGSHHDDASIFGNFEDSTNVSSVAGTETLANGDAEAEAVVPSGLDASNVAEVPRVAAEDVSGKALLMRRIFEPVKDRLFYTVAHNYVLKDYLGNLLRAIASGGG